MQTAKLGLVDHVNAASCHSLSQLWPNKGPVKPMVDAVILGLEERGESVNLVVSIDLAT